MASCLLSKELYVQKKPEVHFLPMIDLNPSDETCIYSALLYIEEQAKQLEMPIATITFDQPLWPKAIGIIEGKKMNNVNLVEFIP